MSGSSEVRRALRLCAPYALKAIPIFAIMCTISVLGLIPPYITGKVIDALSIKDPHAVIHLLVLYLAAVASSAVLSFVNTWMTTNLRETFARDLRSEMVDALYEAPYQDAAAIPPGEITNRLSGDIDALSTTLQYSLFPLFSAAVMFVTTSTAMIAMEWHLGVVALITLCGLWVPTRVVARKLSRYRTLLSEAKDRLDARVLETLTPQALALVKCVGAQSHELFRFRSAADDVRRVNLKSAVVSASYGVFSSGLTALGPALTLGLGAYYVANGHLSVGMLVALLSYQLRMYAPAGTLWSMQMQLAGIAAIMKRVCTIVDLPLETDGDETPSPGSIQFDNVAVERSGVRTLDAVSLEIPFGSHVGIVGRSGSGKSTIASLLCRLLEPTQGRVLISGTPVRDIRIEDLRSFVHVVQQDGHLFDESVSYNVAYGSQGIGREQIASALALVGGEDLEMEDEARGALGTRAARISGGQRQRLCLARAVVRSPQVLVLDEVTTGLDPESEAGVLSSLRRLMAQRTLLVITHRLRTLATMDFIIVIDKGRVVAQGSHDALLSSCQLYRTLYEHDIAQAGAMRYQSTVA